MASFSEFRSQVLGKAFDIDGYYGAQCWDGYAKYCQYLGYGIAHCTTSGYVKDLWNNRQSNGILNYFDEVEVMQAGDVAVFKEVEGITPWSHVAIFVKDNGNGTGVFLGQNQGGANGAFNEVNLPYSATFATAFRPKMFASSSNTGGDANTSTTDAPNQVLEVGSKVKFTGFLKVEKYANGLVYNSRIGGGVNPSICYEDSANDGAQDQYFATTNATFTIPGEYTVGNLRKVNGVWQAYLNELGFWVNCEPLIETKNG